MTSSSELRPKYIFDTCILIDYYRANPLLFGLIKNYLGGVLISSPIIDELNEITEDELIELGVEIFEPELEDAIQAKTTEYHSNLSFVDAICFFSTIRENAFLVTNDKHLREMCEKHSVKTIWGLELILDLHRAEGISTRGAKRTAQEIHKNDPNYFPNELIAEFTLKLKKQASKS